MKKIILLLTLSVIFLSVNINADNSLYSANRAMESINFALADDYYREKDIPVTIALIDTGIDINHKSLSGRIWKNEGEIPENGIDDDQNGYTDDINGWNFSMQTNEVFIGSEDDHGTHIAGIIAAKEDNSRNIKGICESKNIKIMCLKVLSGKERTGSVSSVIEAIKYAEKNGADICNLSLATKKDNPLLYEVISESRMLFVTASGNNGENIDTSPVYPACYNLPNLISVANISSEYTLSENSNYGLLSVDIAAPGHKILSLTSSNSFSFMSGTSMSAAYVSGTAALIISHLGGEISAEKLKSIILSYSNKIPPLQENINTGSTLSVGNAIYHLSLTRKPYTKKDSFSLLKKNIRPVN